jgi:ribA/ribD-fused uncharacterized protein
MEKVNIQLANAFERMSSAVEDRAAGRRTVDNMVVFEERTSPLSLTFPTMIDYEGMTFHSADHLLNYFKAKSAGDEEAAAKIGRGSAKDSRSIPINRFNANHWKKIEHAAVNAVCAIKVKQCEEMRAELKNSGGKRLVYSSTKDPYFSCGLGINDGNVFFPQFWRGQNSLGKILEALRKTV